MQVTEPPAGVTAATANGIPVEVTGEPVGLYRFYDAAGQLLYVGITRNLATRWSQHQTEKSWWPAVARKTVVMYGSRREAELAEGRAIRSESPLHNKAMGRRDKSQPKQPAPKLPPPRRPHGLTSRDSFAINADLRAYVDDYASRQKISSVEAVRKFFTDGMIKCLEEELAADVALFEAEQGVGVRPPAA